MTVRCKLRQLSVISVLVILSSKKRKKRKEKKPLSTATSCNDWAASVPRKAKPASKATSKVISSIKATSRGSSLFLPLTEAATRSSASSVLTKSITVFHKTPNNIKLEADNDVFAFIGGGLSDEDETNGIEQDAAVASPPKGKKCVTSAISNFFQFCISSNLN
jgi:hypothetical protein